MPDLTGPISTLPGSGYSDDDCRIVPCQACGGEGRLYGADGYDRGTGAPQEHDEGPCPYCEGTGGEIIAVEPITIDDLSTDHERIWLQSAKDANSDTGRLWCEDKVWPDDIDVGEPTEYVRADLFNSMKAALVRAERKLSASDANSWMPIETAPIGVANKTKHTPGPWEAIGDAVFKGRNCIVICDTDNDTAARYEANARLIAATPDLLASLQEISTMFMARQDMLRALQPLMGAAEKATFDRAAAAIAKATA